MGSNRVHHEDHQCQQNAPLYRPTVALEKRLFWNSVVSEDEYFEGTPCWIWIGHRAPRKGYGRLTIRVGGKPRGQWAHRIAYEVFIGPIPADRDVHHKCYTTCCINPAHFELLSKAANTRDANARRYDGR
jgi:hypothetical protein